MEHYDGEFYTLRLFSPIEGEIYSLNSTEEGLKGEEQEPDIQKGGIFFEAL